MWSVESIDFVNFMTSLTADDLLYLFYAVEFPAVLLNMRSGEIEAEFHQYVQPQENPILSDFCKQLTGISQVPCLLWGSSSKRSITWTACPLSLHPSSTESVKFRLDIEHSLSIHMC